MVNKYKNVPKLATRNLARVLPRRKPKTGFRSRRQIDFTWKMATGRGFICWTSVIRVGQPCVVPLPSWLGVGLSQWSRWVVTSPSLFFQNLRWVGGYGLQCLGPEEFSGNIRVSETCDFFNTISFCRFSNFKNLSSPELALFQGVFRNYYFE